MTSDSGRRLLTAGDVEGVFDSFELLPPIEAILATNHNSWAISADLARALARLIVRHRPTRILEFGAGVSSMVLSTSLQLAGGGMLTSVEQSPEWCEQQWRSVRRCSQVDSCLIPAEVRRRFDRHGLYFGYDGISIEARAPFDLVFIDAPQGYYGRDGALHACYDFLAAGSVVVLDDATRPNEQRTLRRWLSIYPGLELIRTGLKGGRGTAILMHNGDKRVFSTWTIRAESLVWYAGNTWQRIRGRRNAALKGFDEKG